MERRHSGEGSQYGFTLIELLIVIVVLGILAAIVVFSLTGVTGQSKQAACTADAKSVEIAADAFQAQDRATLPTESSRRTWCPTTCTRRPGTGNGYTIGLGTEQCHGYDRSATAAAVQRHCGLPGHPVVIRLDATQSARPSVAGRFGFASADIATNEMEVAP